MTLRWQALSVCWWVARTERSDRSVACQLRASGRLQSRASTKTGTLGLWFSRPAGCCSLSWEGQAPSKRAIYEKGRPGFSITGRLRRLTCSFWFPCKTPKEKHTHTHKKKREEYTRNSPTSSLWKYRCASCLGFVFL